MKEKQIYTVRYEHPYVGEKGECLYYTLEAKDEEHAKEKSMKHKPFTDKIWMKHFNKKYLHAFIPKGKDIEVGKVEYYEGDPRL